MPNQDSALFIEFVLATSTASAVAFCFSACAFFSASIFLV